MNKVFIIIYCIIISTSSCQSNKDKYKEVKTIHTSSSLKFEIDTTTNIWGDADSIKKRCLTEVLHYKQTDYVAYLHDRDMKVDVFNLSNMQLYTTYDFSIEQEKYNEVNALVLASPDSIFIIQFNRISLLYKNQIINQWLINTDTNAINCIDNLENTSYSFDSKRNELFLTQYRCSSDFDNFDYFKSSPFQLFSISTSNSRIPNITYSTKFFENYYGFLNKAYVSSDIDNIYISYAIDPNIYIINKSTLKQRCVGGRSSYQKHNIKPLDNRFKDISEVKIKHASISNKYMEVYPDQFRKLYYRPYIDERPEKKNNGLYTTNKDNRQILMVFDSSFQLINEIVFEQNNKIKSKLLIKRDGVYFKSENGYKVIKTIQGN